ncbi:MAG: hypothetical protein IPM14_18030 [bacterium]|nr:hypothetical protein [bacterium]
MRILLFYKESETGVFEIDDVWKRVKKIFFPVFLTGIGYSFFVGLGFVFLIVPGIYLSITLSIIFIVRLEEEIGFFDAVSRCIKLIKDNWWFTFGFILVIGIIQGFLTYALYIPTYIMMFVTAFSGVDSESSGLNRILYIITSIISSLGVILYSISTVAIAFHYYNLVERKEAPGLLEQIDQIK